MYINKVTLMGRLTKDPEVRKTQAEKSVVKFTVAVNREHNKDNEKKADFIDCVAFGITAEFVSKYFRKGSCIIVDDAEIRTEMYEKDGQKRKSVEIVAKHVKFGEAKKQDGNAGQDSQYDDMTEVSTSDELPF